MSNANTEIIMSCYKSVWHTTLTWSLDFKEKLEGGLEGFSQHLVVTQYKVVSSPSFWNFLAIRILLLGIKLQSSHTQNLSKKISVLKTTKDIMHVHPKIAQDGERESPGCVRFYRNKIALVLVYNNCYCSLPKQNTFYR